MHSNPPPGILTPKNSIRSGSPGISIALWIVGAIALGLSIFGIFDALSSGSRDSTVGLFAGAISSLVLIALGSAIDKLDHIRHYAQGILENTQPR